MSKSMPLLPALVKEVPGKSLNSTEPPPGKSPSSSSQAGVTLPKVNSESRLQERRDLIAQGNDIRFQEFLARQSNSSLEVRLQLAKTQRDELSRTRAESASGKFVGVSHFRLMLQHRFVTITAAWRQLLDPASTGKVSFCDFCQCCRDLGYQRRMKQLWMELDTEQKGWIGLDQLDPEAAQLLRDFRRLCKTLYGSMLAAWHAFDRDKNHRLDFVEFEKCCSEVNFSGNARRLFTALKIDISRKYLTIQDFDQKSMTCLYRGDAKMMTVEGFHGQPQEATVDEDLASASSTSPAKRNSQRTSTLNTRWITECSQEQIRTREEKRKKIQDLDQGMKSLTALKRQLVAHFGSIYSAWRQALDLDGNGRLSFGEFCIALRNLGYGGNVKDTFHALDRDSDGFIGLGDIDAKINDEINSYKKLILDKYPNMLAAWRESINAAAGGSGQIDEKQFTQHCKELGWSGNAHSLFQNLKEERCRRFLTLRDYDIRAWHAMNRGDTDMISEEKGSTAQLSKVPFHERQENSFKQRWSRMKAKHDLEDLEQARKEKMSLDKGAQSAEAFRMLLLRKYGTMTAAWKHGLDVYGNGRLALGEFCNALRCLGFTGDVQKCFKQLDTEEKGALTLKDLDKDAYEVVTEFRTLLLEKYGTYIKGWQAMDTNRNNAIEADEMAAACEAIGYHPGNAKAHDTLFRMLLDGPGRRSITMADLDPAAMQAYWRGDLDALSPVDKAKASLKAKQKEAEEAKQKSMEAHDWPSLKKLLIRKYGTITAAWREGLDVAGNGKLSFIDFSKQVRNAGFCGNIKQVFKELDDDNSGIISFNEVDNVSYDRLANFNGMLLKKFPTYEDAWAAVDTNHSNTVEIHEFDTLCADIGYQGDPKALYRHMLPNTLRKHLALEDLICNAAIIHGNKADPNSSMTFYTHKDGMLSKDEKAKKDLEDRKAMVKRAKTMQVGAGNWPSLKEQLIRKYGSIVAAWRFALDSSGDGKLSHTEFCTACRNNGFQGNISECFHELDQSGSGVITFGEIDQEWFVKLQSFQDLLLKKYETPAKAWKALDHNHSGQPLYQDLEKVCTVIGYTEDAKLLFKQLVKDYSRRFVTEEDLDSLRTLLAMAKASESKSGEQSQGLQRKAGRFKTSPT